MDSYIVRNSDGIYSVYYENNCIYQKKRTETGWSEPKTIAVNTGKNFSLLRSIEGEPVVIYCDKAGNLMVAGNNNPHKMVLRNTSEIRTMLHIDGIINDNTIRLFYNKDYINESCLTEQHRRGDGSWSNPLILDNYIQDNNLTKLICLNGNYIIFYSKKVPEQQIGYREISLNYISEFKLLYSTGYKISDYSLAVTDDEIHFAAIINTFRTSKLIYAKKNSSGISKARILYEGPVKLCHISIQNNKLIIIFSTSRGNHQVTSFDMGASFKRTEPLSQFPFSKSWFADYTRQIPDNFVASELITDPVFPFKIKMCPFITDDDENEINKLKKEIERLKKVAKI